MSRPHTVQLSRSAVLITMSISTAFMGVVIACGCHMISHAPNPKWLADFNQADTLSIQNRGDQIVVTDQEVINRLREIYSRAKWKPYRTTLPGDLNE